MPRQLVIQMSQWFAEFFLSEVKGIVLTQSKTSNQLKNITHLEIDGKVRIILVRISPLLIYCSSK